MKKLFLFIVFFALFTFVIFGVYVYFCRASFTSAVMSKTLATKVTIGAIDLGLRGVVVENVQVANPPGCLAPNAFAVDAIQVNLPWKELAFGVIGYINDPIEVERIEINHPQISVEIFNTAGSDNNWKRLMGNMPPQKPSTKTQSPRTFVIKEIEFTDVVIEAKNRAQGNAPITVPQIRRLKITPSPNGERRTSEEIARMVLLALSMEIGKQMGLQQFSKEIEQFYGLPPGTLEGKPSWQEWFEEKKGQVTQEFQKLFETKE